MKKLVYLFAALAAFAFVLSACTATTTPTANASQVPDGTWVSSITLSGQSASVEIQYAGGKTGTLSITTSNETRDNSAAYRYDFYMGGQHLSSGFNGQCQFCYTIALNDGTPLFNVSSDANDGTPHFYLEGIGGTKFLQ